MTSAPPLEQGALDLEAGLRAEKGLDSAAFVHGLVALGGLIKREGEVEDLAGFDGPAHDQLDQLGQVLPDGGWAAVQVDVGEEQLLAGQRDVVGDADIAHMAAWAGGVDGL